MLVFLAIVYAFFIWLVYFKLKLFPYNTKHKIISTLIGTLGLLTIALIIFRVAPYSNNLLIEAHVNPVSARVSGRVGEIYVQPRELVRKGDRLFSLDPKSYVIALDQARGNLAAAQANFDRAKAQYDIAMGLLKADPESITQLQIIDAEQNLKQMEGQLSAAKSAVDTASDNLSKTVVYAPATGFTPFIVFDNQTNVTAYTPIMSFVSIEDFYPIATFSQKALGLVQPGDPVEITINLYPGYIFQGKVEEIFWAAGEAQILQGEQIPAVDKIAAPHQFVVIIDLDERDQFPLRFGARGGAVIYTQYGKSIHIIQKVFIRMQSWLDYIAIPWF